MDERDKMIVDHKRIRVIGDNENIEIFPNEVIVFKIAGMYIPAEPFGREYYMTDEYKDFEIVRVKSLTLSNLLISATKNSVVLFLYKIKYILYKMGFINHTDPYVNLKFKEFTFNRKKTLKQRAREDTLDKRYGEIVDYMEHMFEK